MSCRSDDTRSAGLMRVEAAEAARALRSLVGKGGLLRAVHDGHCIAINANGEPEEHNDFELVPLERAADILETVARGEMTQIREPGRYP
jgi:hypothetical protein